MAMFQHYSLRSFEADFNPVPEAEASLPSLAFVKRRLAESLAEVGILRDLFDMGNTQPVRIGQVNVTIASFCQIQDMWWSARDHSCLEVAPKIALKFFTTSISRSGGEETISVEILPGLDDWTPK